MIFIEEIKIEPISTVEINTFGGTRKVPGRYTSPTAKVILDIGNKEYKELIDNYEKRIEKRILKDSIDNIGVQDLIPVMLSSLLGSGISSIDCISLIEHLSYIVKRRGNDESYELKLLLEKLLFDII